MTTLRCFPGKGMRPSGTAKTSFFLGDCNYAFNRKAQGVNEGVWLKGCPPKISEVIEVFNGRGIRLSEEANRKFFAHKVKAYEKLGFPYEDYYFPKRD